MKKFASRNGFHPKPGFVWFEANNINEALVILHLLCTGDEQTIDRVHTILDEYPDPKEYVVL